MFPGALVTGDPDASPPRPDRREPTRVDAVRLVVQRVRSASVTVDDRVVGEIGAGLLVLVGAAPGDTPEIADRLADKVWGLRILRGERSCSDEDAPLLVVSQFEVPPGP